MGTAALAFEQRVDDWLQCLAYMERVTCILSIGEGCANDGDHFENNIQSLCKLSLSKFLSAFAWSSL